MASRALRIQGTPQGVPIPRFMMARKPAHGAPCTRCGACCVATLCDLARHVFGNRPGPCPALLVGQDKSAACGLTQIGTQQAREAAALLIGTGDGCDARFNGEPVDRGFHAYQARLDIERAEEIKAARALWGFESEEM